MTWLVALLMESAARRPAKSTLLVTNTTPLTSRLYAVAQSTTHATTHQSATAEHGETRGESVSVACASGHSPHDLSWIRACGPHATPGTTSQAHCTGTQHTTQLTPSLARLCSDSRPVMVAWYCIMDGGAKQHGVPPLPGVGACVLEAATPDTTASATNATVKATADTRSAIVVGENEKECVVRA